MSRPSLFTVVLVHPVLAIAVYMPIAGIGALLGWSPYVAIAIYLLSVALVIGIAIAQYLTHKQRP